MSYFHGALTGRSGKPNGVAGSEISGISVRLGSYEGYIRVRCSVVKQGGKDPVDWFQVTLEPAQGAQGGSIMVLAQGSLDGDTLLFPYFSKMVEQELGAANEPEPTEPTEPTDGLVSSIEGR